MSETMTYERQEHALLSPRLSVHEVVGMYRERVDERGPILRQMRRARDAANGDVVIPLNEWDKNAQASVANLFLQGLDQMSMRIASVMPGVWFPPMSEGERNKQTARTKKAAVLSWWDDNRMEMKIRRRSRHYMAYSESPVMVKPDMDHYRVRWFTCDPLDTFPCPSEDDDELVPRNTIRCFRMTYAKIAKYHPEAATRLRVPANKPNTEVTVLEYQDEYEVTQIAVGTGDVYGEQMIGTDTAVRLTWAPNRAGRPLVVLPRRIVLDRARGAYDDTIGMYYTRARLQALNEIAIERGIFPDQYLVQRPGENAEIVQEADGRMGVLGVVRGGDIQTENLNPGYKTDTAIDRVERQERNSAGIPAEFGGESASNIRTGRRGDSVLSATVDFRIQEAQKSFADSLTEENKIAMAIEKGYWGERPRSFFFPGKVLKSGDYVPNKLWDSPVHYVSYAMPGSDLNNMVVGLGQRVGAGLMSQESARENDPLIADPDLEHDRIAAESVERALLSAVQAQAADPNGPFQPADLALLVRLVTQDNKSVFEAVEEVHRKAQERQAQQVPPDAPEAQPGLAMPGMGAESPAVPAPDPSVSNFAALMGQLRRPAAVAEAM